MFNINEVKKFISCGIQTNQIEEQNVFDNRLIYFFQDMTVYRRPRPAYYIYLTGLFFDIYSVSVQYINYLDFLINPYTEATNEKFKY